MYQWLDLSGKVPKKLPACYFKYSNTYFIITSPSIQLDINVFLYFVYILAEEKLVKSHEASRRARIIALVKRVKNDQQGLPESLYHRSC